MDDTPKPGPFELEVCDFLYLTRIPNVENAEVPALESVRVGWAGVQVVDRRYPRSANRRLCGVIRNAFLCHRVVERDQR